MTYMGAALERIALDNRLLAVIIRRDFETRGSQNFSDPDDVMQVEFVLGERGQETKAHFHPPLPNEWRRPRVECIHVDDGRALVQIFTREGEYVRDVTLLAGDTIVLYEGHNVKFDSTARLLVFKEGPNPGPSRDRATITVNPAAKPIQSGPQYGQGR